VLEAEDFPAAQISDYPPSWVKLSFVTHDRPAAQGPPSVYDTIVKG
jgi:hypothetical protein